MEIRLSNYGDETVYVALTVGIGGAKAIGSNGNVGTDGFGGIATVSTY